MSRLHSREPDFRPYENQMLYITEEILIETDVLIDCEFCDLVRRMIKLLKMYEQVSPLL